MVCSNFVKKKIETFVIMRSPCYLCTIGQNIKVNILHNPQNSVNLLSNLTDIEPLRSSLNVFNTQVKELQTINIDIKTKIEY